MKINSITLSKPVNPAPIFSIRHYLQIYSTELHYSGTTLSVIDNPFLGPLALWGNPVSHYFLNWSIYICIICFIIVIIRLVFEPHLPTRRQKTLEPIAAADIWSGVRFENYANPWQWRCRSCGFPIVDGYRSWIPFFWRRVLPRNPIFDCLDDWTELPCDLLWSAWVRLPNTCEKWMNEWIFP